MPSGHASRRAAARCGYFSAPARESSLPLTTEQRLIRAYLALFVTSPNAGGTKTVPLARFGAYEVRLCEPTDEAETFPLLIELYAHDRCATLDSFGCDELEVAVSTADEFMLRARQLKETADRFGSLRR